MEMRSDSESSSDSEVEPRGSMVSYTVSLDALRYENYQNHLQRREPKYTYRVDFIDEARYQAEDPAGPSLRPGLLKVIIIVPEEREDVWLHTRYDHVSRVQFVLFPQDDETLYYLRLWKFENGTEVQMMCAGLLSAALAGNPFVFDKEAVQRSCSAWQAKLKWTLAPLLGSREILQAERPVRFGADAPAAHIAAAPAAAAQDCVIVSITGAKRVTSRRVDGVLQEFQQLPHVYVNGSYLRTNYVQNGGHVFVKIEGEFYSIHNRICLIKSRRENHWSFRTSADSNLRAFAGNGNEVRTFAHIQLPPNAFDRFRQLDELAAAYDLEVRVPVPGRPRGRDHCETCQGTTVTVQTEACTGVLARLAEIANTHVRRKLLLDKQVECGFCMESKPFREFLVPECGHAYCKDCYRRWLAANPHSRCPQGCAVLLSNYNAPQNHSDYYPLWVDDAAASSVHAPSAGASADAPAARHSSQSTGNHYVVRTRAFCFRAV